MELGLEAGWDMHGSPLRCRKDLAVRRQLEWEQWQ